MSVKIMRAVWDYGPADSTQRFVLLAIADNTRDDGSHAWPSVKELAAKCAISERTVVRAIEALIAGGYLTRQRRQNTSNIYQIVLERLRPNPVSDNLTLPEVTQCHPEGCQDVTHGGDTVSPDPSLIHHPIHQNDPSPAAAPTATEPPAPAAAAAADPLVPILDWLGFDDALTPKERQALTVADLLAWAYWAKIKQAESRGRITNPIGWARSQWRNGRPPRADLLRLARGWLLLDDDARARLLGRIEWANDYGNTPGDVFEEEFPDIPPVAAAAVHTATGGELGPPALSPAQVIAPAGAPPPKPAGRPVAASSTNGATNQTQTTGSALWRDALAELEMQMARATFTQLLAGTTATLTDDDLAVHARTPATAEWLQQRLHPIVQRAVHAAAGRPITVRYEVSQ